MAAMRFLLAFLGRHGAIGFALSIFLGLALPQFAAQARPVLPVSIFFFTVITFLRADPAVIGGLVRRPRPLIAAFFWMMLLPPALIGLAIFTVGRAAMDPGLLLGLAIFASAPPIMSGPAIAILYGFEPSLIIASMLSLTIIAPVYSPLMVDLLAGQAVPIDSTILMLRLAGLIGGGIATAMILRRLMGPQRIGAIKSELDGIGVIMYFVFAVAAMDGVTAAAMAQPALVASFLAYVFSLAGLGIVLTMLALRLLSVPDRFTIGYGSLQRNMGLLIAALGPGVPPNAFLFFALAQFPIYLSPWLLTPLVRAIRQRQRDAPGD